MSGTPPATPYGHETGVHSFCCDFSMRCARLCIRPTSASFRSKRCDRPCVRVRGCVAVDRRDANDPGLVLGFDVGWAGRV